MRNKLLIATVCSLITFNCVANADKLTVEQIRKQSDALLAKAGIEILPYNQVSIVPSDKYLNDKNLKLDPNIQFEQDSIRKYLAMNEEQQKNGYVNQDEPRAKELIEMKRVAHEIINQYQGNFEPPPSRQMWASIKEIPMAYNFVGVPEKEMQLNIGIAPFGSYRLVKEGAIQNGWDGAVQFFNNSEVGSCAFTEHNRKLAGAGAEILKEFVTSEINDKPTVILVTGNERSGFVYKIQWYTDVFNRQLECANPKFSQQLRSSVISLAQHIESFQ